jgi:hypothetical protein
MAVQKNWHRVIDKAGKYDTFQALTGDSTGTALTGYGVTTITVTTGEGTAANLAYALSVPLEVGARKTVLLSVPGASTKDVTLQTGANLYGSTGMTVIANSTKVADQGKPQVLEFLGVTSTSWALVNYNSTSPIVTFGT